MAMATATTSHTIGTTTIDRTTTLTTPTITDRITTDGGTDHIIILIIRGTISTVTVATERLTQSG